MPRRKTLNLIESLVYAINALHNELVKVDKSGILHLWVPMILSTSSPSPTRFDPLSPSFVHLYPTFCKISNHEYFLTTWTRLGPLPRVPTNSLMLVVLFPGFVQLPE